MTETTTTTEAPRAEPRRLVRIHESRWLGGVCTGLGRYFDMSPAVYRVGFVVLTLVGGTGALLYLAAWLVIPDEAAPDSIAVQAIRDRRDRPWLVFGLGLLGFAAIVWLSQVRFAVHPADLWLAALIVGGGIVAWHFAGGRAEAVPRERRPSLFPAAVGILIAVGGLLGLLEAVGATNIDWRIVLAVAALLAGAAVVVGAATGRAVGAVAMLGLVLLVALALAFALRVPLFAGVGDRVESPILAAGFDRTYKLGIGNLTVDLRGMQLQPGTTKVRAQLGIGDLVVRVPYGVTVAADGHASAGNVRVFGRERNGVGVRREGIAYGPQRGARQLVVDADVGIGQVEVRRG
jgi:phage shock protein PspC (stress-responsive transcriptional regulator)